MSFNMKVGGTWPTMVSGWVKVAGTWQEVQTAWVKVAGTWQQVYSAVSYALSGETAITGFQTQPNTAIAGVRINADGTIDKITGNASSPTYTQIDTTTDWVIPNGAATGDERFKCTDNNANLASGTTGTWLAAPQQWYITHGGAIEKLLDITLEISILGDTTTDDSDSYTGGASAEP